MSASFNTHATNETTIKQKFDNSICEKEKCLLRKQFIQIIPSCFLQEKKQTHFYVSSSTTLKNHKQSEEFNKIQSEIAIMEEKIDALEMVKKTKLAKIKDLRHIIQRIANEDSYTHCFFKASSYLLCSSKNNNNNMPRERCDKKQLRPSKKCHQQQDNQSNQVMSSSTTTTTLEPQPEQDPQGDGIKSGVHSCCRTTNDDETEATDYLRSDNNNSSNNNYTAIPKSISTTDELSQALSFWQEYLPEMPKVSNCFMH